MMSKNKQLTGSFYLKLPTFRDNDEWLEMGEMSFGNFYSYGGLQSLNNFLKMAEKKPNAMKKIQMETQSKMQVAQAQAAFDIETKQQEAALKQQLMSLEFQFNMQLHGMQQSQMDEREEMREQGKKERISMANTQQSKMIEQRKRNLPAFDFESNEDSLDGFDLSEFEPR